MAFDNIDPIKDPSLKSTKMTNKMVVTTSVDLPGERHNITDRGH